LVQEGGGGVHELVEVEVEGAGFKVEGVPEIRVRCVAVFVGESKNLAAQGMRKAAEEHCLGRGLVDGRSGGTGGGVPLASCHAV
jgi:hypothetical protein